MNDEKLKGCRMMPGTGCIILFISSILLSNSHITNAINSSVNRMIRMVGAFLLSIQHMRGVSNKSKIATAHTRQQVSPVTNGGKGSDKK